MQEFKKVTLEVNDNVGIMRLNDPSASSVWREGRGSGVFVGVNLSRTFRLLVLNCRPSTTFVE